MSGSEGVEGGGEEDEEKRKVERWGVKVVAVEVVVEVGRRGLKVILGEVMGDIGCNWKEFVIGKYVVVGRMRRRIIWVTFISNKCSIPTSVVAKSLF